MRKRNSLIVFLILIFSIGAPALANAKEDRVILDQLLTGDVPQLNAEDIKIPDDLKPGYHELKVEVLDDLGVVSSKTALFCKSLDGELHFDNNCPDLLITNEKKVFRSAYKTYDPISDPEGTATLALVAFAVAGTLLGFGSNKFEANPAISNDEQDSMGDLGSVAAANLATRDLEQGWGDRRWYINRNFFNSLDELSTSTARGISGFSGLLARAILDARYLRAIFGNLAWLTVPAALVVSFLGLQQIDNQALPFNLTPLLILMCIGIFDALAGFFGAFLYLNFIFANGNFTSKEEVFTGLGVALIFFAPGLIASKFRPLTRRIKDFASFWERATDYVLASLLTGWSVSKLVAALPGLSKLQLPIVDHANQIGLIAGIAVVVRLLFEEIAWYLFPVRLIKLTTELKKPGIIQDLRAIVFKTGIFYLLAEPFIGFNKYLFAGCGVFVFPQLLGLFSHKFPKANVIDQIVPRGSFKIVFLSILSIFGVSYLKTLELNHREFVFASFVYLPLPALALVIIEMFAGNRPFDLTKNLKFRFFYRLSGIAILGILIMIVLGLDPYLEIKNFILNLPNYWSDFIQKMTIFWNWIANHAVLSWNWIANHAVLSWNWIANHAVLSWNVIKNEWVPNIKYHIYH